MNRPLFLAALLTAFFAVPALAITIGELQPGGGTVASRGGELAPLTIINFSRPALQTGTVDRATIMWTGAPAAGCTNAFRIKFFRPTSNGLQVVAERGPFNAQQGINNVQLAPAVSILEGDLIGIAQLQPVACGGVVNRRTDSYETWGSVDADPAVGPTIDDIGFINGLVPSVLATNESAPLHGYLPVTGSAPGNFGSFFKTSVQLTNRGTATISGRLVFHPAGRSAQSTDPVVTYSLAPNQTQSVQDIVAAAGAAGVGSMDLLTTSGYPPDVTARIYDDRGTGGTSGFTEELMTAYEALHRFERGSLTVPTDLTNFRMNIGVRSLGEGATLNFFQYDASGELTAILGSRTYGPNFFEQLTAGQFLGGDAAAGGYIVVQVESGSAFLYASVTDNRTNDSSIRFPKKY